ncbi:stalk domain-containing protein [Paenibacillus ottowii]
MPAKAAFEAKGAKFSADTKVITVTKDSNKLELPVYKSIATLNGKHSTLNGKHSTLNGVIVFNGVDYFVPQQAIDLIQ